jgi:hypothetical protein
VLAFSPPLDLRAALLERGDHLALCLQPGGIVVGMAQGDGALREETVTAGAPAGREAEHRAGHHLRAVQHDQAVRRPHELRVARAPAHHLGDRQARERSLHEPREHVGELRPRHRALDQVDEALAGLQLRERGRIDPVFACEAGDGFGRRLDRGTLHLLAQVRRLGEHAGNGDGQAAGRREVARHAVGAAQARAFQVVHQVVAEGASERLERLRRQLLGEQLDEQGVRLRHADRLPRHRH